MKLCHDQLGPDQMIIKITKVDSIAKVKGFRRGQVRKVIAVDVTANPERGCLVIVQNKHGVPEGFFPDQYRIMRK